MLNVYLSLYELFSDTARKILTMRMRLALVLVMSGFAVIAHPWAAAPVFLMVLLILTLTPTPRALLFTILAPAAAVGAYLISGTWTDSVEASAVILVMYILCEAMWALDAFLGGTK